MPRRYAKENRWPSNADDLNARHRRVNTRPLAGRGIPGVPRKNTGTPLNQSSKPACKQGSQYVGVPRRRKPERYFSGNGSCVFRAAFVHEISARESGNTEDEMDGGKRKGDSAKGMLGFAIEDEN